MSELKVNKISPRSGTDVTLGDSGDTFTLPTGVTLDTSNSTVTLPDGTVTNAKISDSTIELAKLSATGTKDATTFLRGDNTFAEAGGGKVLQVVHGTDETARETTSTTYASLTLNASITPSATSSKVLAIVNLATSSAFQDKYAFFTLYRGATDLGNSGGSGFFYTYDDIGSDVYMSGSFAHLDSPSSISSLSYTLYGKCTSGGKARINTNGGRSTITLIEIGA